MREEKHPVVVYSLEGEIMATKHMVHNQVSSPFAAESLACLRLQKSEQI